MNGMTLHRPHGRAGRALEKKTVHHRSGRMVYIGIRDMCRCWKARWGICRIDGHQPWRVGTGLEMYCYRCHQNVHWND